MIEVEGNFWDETADWYCIPTNGFVKKNGCAVMGRGLALQARTRFKGIDRVLGQRLETRGNHVLTMWKQVLPKEKGYEEDRVFSILSFPTKRDWRDDADPELIRRSCRELHLIWEEAQLVSKKVNRVLLPRVGTGNGRLRWGEVRSIIVEELPEDSFVVISPPKEVE